VSGTANTVAKFTTSTTIGNSQIIDDGARVGIGVTPTINKLEVGGSLTVGVGSTGNTDIRFDNTTNGKIHYVFSDSTNGELGIESGASVGIKFNTNGPNTKMVLTSAGNLEFIGTATGLAGSYFSNDNSSLKIHSTFGGGTTKDLILQSGGSPGAPQLILKAGGNVLIGTPTDAGFKLDVNGTTIFRGTSIVRSAGGYSSGLIIENTNTSANNFSVLTLQANTDGFPIIEFKEGNNQKWQIYNDYSNDSLNLYKWVGVAGNVLTLSSTGAATFSSSVTATLLTSGSNLEVGTSSGNDYILKPGVSAAGTGSLIIQGGFGSAGAGGAITLYSHSNATYPGGVFIGRSAGASGPILFGGGGTSPTTEQMRITSTGYVYIGEGFNAVNHRINLAVNQGGGILVVSAYATSPPGSSNDTAIFYGASGASPNGAATALGVMTNSSTGRSINAGGTINASGADYAEYMTKAVEDNIAKGDIVGIDSNGTVTNIFVNSMSFAVKSTDPSYVGGDVWGNAVGKRPSRSTDQTEEEFAPILAEFEVKLEIARSKVDRISFSGQVPCNVTGANVGDYIIPIEIENGKIGGQAVTTPTFQQYQISVGKVWKIMEDGRAWIAVKIG
jgi:hypothetical protein